MFGYSQYMLPLKRRGRSLSLDQPTYLRRPPQRATRSSSRLRLGVRNEAISLGRRREYGPLFEVQKPRLEVGRISAISGLADLEERPARPAVAAKASAADRRYFHPLQEQAPAVNLYGVPARVGVAALVARNQVRDMMRFHRALSVVPCVQRAVRREVLFAVGAHGSHKGKRHKGPFSNIRC